MAVYRNILLSIDIYAEPCSIIGDQFSCGAAGGSTAPTDQQNLAGLAAGDQFATADYTITVTQATGSQASGWSGTGKLTFNFIKLAGLPTIQIPISVTFNGIRINQCYQLAAGKVITEYDPTWSSVESVDEIKNRLTSIYAQIKDLMTDPVANAGLLQAKQQDLLAVQKDINTSQFTPEYKTEQNAGITGVVTALVCKVGSPGTRMAVFDGDCGVETKIGVAENTSENSQLNKWPGDVFDENGVLLDNESTFGNFIVIKSNYLGLINYKLLSTYVFTPSKYSSWAKILEKYWVDLGLSKSILRNNTFTITNSNGGDTYNYPLLSLFPKKTSEYFETDQVVNTIISSVDADNTVPWTHKGNIKSGLYHEYLHLIGKKIPNDLGSININNHLEVYYAQFSKDDFESSTSLGFRTGLHSTVYEYYIHQLIYQNPTLYNFWLNKFKKLKYSH